MILIYWVAEIIDSLNPYLDTVFIKDSTELSKRRA